MNASIVLPLVIAVVSASGFLGAAGLTYYARRRIDEPAQKQEATAAALQAAAEAIRMVTEGRDSRSESLLKELDYWRTLATDLRARVDDHDRQLRDLRQQHQEQIARREEEFAAQRRDFDDRNRRQQEEITRLALKLGEYEDKKGS